jgi:hypothetical protein
MGVAAEISTFNAASIHRTDSLAFDLIVLQFHEADKEENPTLLVLFAHLLARNTVPVSSQM